MAVLAVLATFALIQRQAAFQQRQVAEDQRELATVRGLLAQAEVARGSDIRLALQLSIAAHRIRPTVETRTSLYTALTSTPLTATLAGHTNHVLAVAFSPDGRTLATGSADNTAGLWDIRGPIELQEDLIDRSCAAAGGGIDRQQWNTVAPGMFYRQTC